MKKVQIVLDKNGGILEPLARQTLEELKEKRFDVELTVRDIKSDKDVYITYIYLNAKPIPDGLNVVFVTHVDRLFKAWRLIRLAMQDCVFVCMSGETKLLVERYTGSDRVYFINPKSLRYGEAKPVNVTIGVFSNIYPDGRKGDYCILNVLKEAEKFGNVNFRIMGSGWQKILSKVDGGTYVYHDEEFNLEVYNAFLSECDYVAYFGEDEGAISILDATALGKPVLAVEQGFHRDLPRHHYSKFFKSTKAMSFGLIELMRSLNGTTNQTTWSDIVNLKVRKSPLKLFKALYIFKLPFVRNSHSIEFQRFLSKILGK